MGTLAALTTEEVLDIMLGATPQLREVHEAMSQAHVAAWSATPPRLLELARLLVALLLHCDAESAARTPAADVDDETVAELVRWPTSASFTEAERAALAFTEQFVTDVASLTDDVAAGLHEHLGDAGLSDFTRALLVVEQRIRLRLAWDQLLEGDRK